MASGTKPSRTAENPSTVLHAIKEKLRPVLLRAWRKSVDAAAVAVASTESLSAREVQIYLKGFQQGWVSGALDMTQVSPTDLQAPGPQDLPEVH
jgi:hypothetical protein